MKRPSIILITALILALTIVLITDAGAQDKNTKIYMDSVDQSRPSTPGLILAYHDLPKEIDHRDNSDINEILDFIDESIKKRTLLGYESDPIYGEDPLAGGRGRLNILKSEIVTAANVLENGKFAEACQHLLNAQLVAEKEEKKVRFLTLNKDKLVDEMIKQDVGQKPYKIERYLNKRFAEYYDCLLLADSNSLTPTIAQAQAACK